MSVTSRYDDCWRETPLYKQLIREGKTEEEALAETNKLIGDDLSAEDLDNLWSAWYGEADPNSVIPGW